MSILPTATVTFPFLGAGLVLLLSALHRFRFVARLLALAIAGLTIALVLGARRAGPSLTFLSSWQPTALFGASLAMQVDPAIQPLALSLSLCTFSAFLAALDRAGKSHPLSATLATASSLAMLGAALLSLFSANPLTMMVGWAVYDLAQAWGHVLLGKSGEAGTSGLIFGTLASVCLWSGAALSPSGLGHMEWPMVTLSDAQSTLWAIAGLLRLRLFPLHLATLTGTDTARPLSVPLFVGPVLGWGLWLRLTQISGGYIGSHAWVPGIAAIAFVVGGFLAWSCRSAHGFIPWVGMATSGGVLLVAGVAPESAATLISAGGVAWVVGSTLLLLREGYDTRALWWSIPSLVGVLVVLGLPLTPGFVTGATLVGRLSEASPGWWGSAFLVGNTLLVSALVRGLLSSPREPVTDQRWSSFARKAWLLVLALLSITVSVRPSMLFQGSLAPQLGPVFALPVLSEWVAWASSLAIGVALGLLDASLRGRFDLLLEAAHDLVRLEWMYDLVKGALKRGLRMVQATEEIVGGSGAVLWSLLLLLLIVLLWGSQ